MNRVDFDTFHDTAAKLLAGQGGLQRLQSAGVNGALPERGAWRQLAQAGWFRLLLQEQHGGLGLDVQALGAIFLAVGSQPVRGPLLEHTIALPMLRPHAAEGPSARLDAALDGERFICVAQPLAAPYSGKGIELRELQLRGTVDLVSFGQWADDIVVVAKADDGAPALVLLEAAQARRSAMDSVDPCADYCRLEFANVPVREDDVLLRGAAASRWLEHCADIQRLMAAAEISGGVTQMVHMSVEYAKTRQQFGRPIGSFQALQHLLADMAASSAALRNLVHATLADSCATPARLHERAIIAKAYACTVGRELGQQALQVHGGIGFTTELPLHIYMRRVLTYQGLLGETDALLIELGTDLLRQEHWE